MDEYEGRKRNMARKKKSVETIHVMNGIEATIMPQYNAFAGGYGLHKSAKYPNRQARKNEVRKEILSY